MKHLALAAVLAAALPAAAHAQHPDHVAVHPALALWTEGNPHVGGAVTWRKNLWRNWALNAGYMLTRSLYGEPHWDHIWWAGAEYSVGPADDRVPYLLLGSVAGGYHTLPPAGRWAILSRDGSVVGGGFGYRYWNADRTSFVAPEVQFAMTSILTFNLAFGFEL